MSEEKIEIIIYKFGDRYTCYLNGFRIFGPDITAMTVQVILRKEILRADIEEALK